MSLRVAVIGLGRMGAEPSERFKDMIPDGWLPLSHAEAIKSTPGLELIALCDTDIDRLNRFKDYYETNNIYQDYRDMIEESKPDIISVATRTDIRCEIINYALTKGVKGFYAEKPLARSIKESAETLDNIQNSNARIVYGATRRAMDVYKKAKEICWSGELGEVIHITVEFGRRTLLWSFPHATDMIVYFSDCSEFEFVQAYCTSVLKGDIHNENIIDSDPVVENAYFRMKNGITATSCPVESFNVRIACSKGIVTVHGNGEHIEINKPGRLSDYFHETEIIKVKADKSGTQYLFEDLRDAVLNNKAVKNISPNEILCGQKMLFGIVQSDLQKGATLPYTDVNEDLVVTGKTGHLYA